MTHECSNCDKQAVWVNTGVSKTGVAEVYECIVHGKFVVKL